MQAGDWRRLRGASAFQQGFAMVLLLAVLATLGAASAVVGPLWAEEVRRDKEDDLLRIGQLYAMAIADYHATAPGNVRHFPPDLESLVEDKRFVGVRRHLRKLYPDPLDPKRPWGLLRDPDGGIRGIFCASDQAPLRAAAMTLGGVDLPAARRYADWHFIAKVKP